MIRSLKINLPSHHLLGGYYKCARTCVLAHMLNRKVCAVVEEKNNMLII